MAWVWLSYFSCPHQATNNLTLVTSSHSSSSAFRRSFYMHPHIDTVICSWRLRSAFTVCVCREPRKEAQQVVFSIPTSGTADCRKTFTNFFLGPIESPDPCQPEHIYVVHRGVVFYTVQRRRDANEVPYTTIQ